MDYETKHILRKLSQRFLEKSQELNNLTQELNHLTYGSDSDSYKQRANICGDFADVFQRVVKDADEYDDLLDKAWNDAYEETFGR